MNKLTIKIYSNLSNINTNYHLKIRIPIIHRKFFKKLSQNKEYVKRFNNNRRKLFHYAIREWTNTCVNDDGMIKYYLIKCNFIFL